MSLVIHQSNNELVKAAPRELPELVLGLTRLVEAITKDTRSIEKTLPQNRGREKLFLRDVRAELSRLKLAADEAMETLPRIRLEGTSDFASNLSTLSGQVTEALEYYVLTLSSTAEKLAKLTETHEISDFGPNSIEIELAEHCIRIDRARSFLNEILSSISK